MRAFLKALLVGALLFAAPAYAEGPQPGVIVIGDDDGGHVDEHMKFMQYIKASGVPVRIEGLCISACTLVALSLPREQVCATPNAFLGFHLLTVNGKPSPELTEIYIRRYYPKVVRDWIDAWVKENGPLTVQRIAFMPAQKALRACAD